MLYGIALKIVTDHKILMRRCLAARFARGSVYAR
jgi:hypothetical protein